MYALSIGLSKSLLNWLLRLFCGYVVETLSISVYNERSCVKYVLSQQTLHKRLCDLTALLDF